jgi:hypothetical protein
MAASVPSNVVPVLMATLVSDAAAIDPATNKKSLIGIWDIFFTNRYPSARPAMVYFKVADAVGSYRFEVDFVRLEGTPLGESLARATFEGQIIDRARSADFVIPFSSLPLPGPGRYEFRILSNGAMIGSTFVDAIMVEPE